MKKKTSKQGSQALRLYTAILEAAEFALNEATLAFYPHDTYPDLICIQQAPDSREGRDWIAKIAQTRCKFKASPELIEAVIRQLRRHVAELCAAQRAQQVALMRRQEITDKKRETKIRSMQDALAGEIDQNLRRWEVQK